MNCKALKAHIILSEKTLDDVIKATNISKSAFYRKLNGKSQFSQSEIVAITQILSLTNEQMIEIFFNKEVS